MRVLILGGTTEGRQLAGLLGARRDLAVTLSLAGRTRAPVLQGVPQAVRVLSGGFGGEEGLVGYLGAERTAAVIDATHPYAARISAHAAAAARRADIPLLALRRPPWKPVSGDRWSEVADARAAAQALGAVPRRAFLALGRTELQPFAGAPQHYYLVRSVEPVAPPPALPRADYLVARGPFAETEERGMLERYTIDIVVAKNSGGEATYGKIAAARGLGLPVVLLRRPELPNAPSATTVAEAVAWVDHALASATMRGV
jgi:precorrin-6A/cobalt-precorrin-6A reductase